MGVVDGGEIGGVFSIKEWHIDRFKEGTTISALNCLGVDWTLGNSVIFFFPFLSFTSRSDLQALMLAISFFYASDSL